MKTILLMAMTVDGKIAKDAAHVSAWTSKADKKIFVEATKNAGVLIMGRTTYDTIGKPLPGRLNVIMTRTPDITRAIHGVLEFTNHKPQALLEELSTRGFHTVIIAGGSVVNGLFIQAGLVDEVWVTIEPKLFGEGVPLVSGAHVDLDMKLIDMQKLNDDTLHLRYQIISKP